MRNVKEAEERKNEILDAVDELFGQKGFDGTSTNDILEKVGIARGTLYYHFKSKEDIMDALIERYHVQLVDAAKKIAANNSLPVTQRLLQVIKALRINHKGGKEIIEQMHKPQNALMHQKTQKAILNGITPILAELVKEGMETGVFDTPYPYESMEMVMTYANGVFDGDMEMTDEEQTKRIEAFAFNMERLLGGKNGTLKDCVMQMFDSE